MKNESIWKEIRRNPGKAFAEKAFITEIAPEKYKEGGRRKMELACIDEKQQIYQWRVKNEEGEDYYFPYMNTTKIADTETYVRSIGHVIVPKNAPDGTIVVTGGMNGCGLQVNIFDDENLIFMHDQDAEAIRNPDSRDWFINGQNLGASFSADDLIKPDRILSRVVPRHYMGPGDIHYRYFFDKIQKQNPEKMLYMAYYAFYIKVQGIWKLYMSLTGSLTDCKDGHIEYVKGDGVYLPNVHCVTSFKIR